MKNNSQMRYTISQKFLGILIPSIMLVVLLTGSIMIGRESAALNEELAAKGAYLAKLAAIMLDPPIWNMNIREIDRVVNALTQNNEIVGARVLDTGQEILFTSAMPQSREALLPWIGPPLHDSFEALFGGDRARAEQAVALYRERYAAEPLIRIVDDAPWVSRIAGRHGVEIGGFTLAPGGKRLVVVDTLDNLLKGAATQAMQNLNRALGFDELTSIPQ